MGKKSAVSLLGGSKPSTKTLAAKQVVRVVGGWGISKREWERSEKKGLDLQASEKAREKVGGPKKKVGGQKKRVGGQKKRVGGQKKGVVGQKKGVWVRKKGLWVKKKGIPLEDVVEGVGILSFADVEVFNHTPCHSSEWSKQIQHCFSLASG